jgi:hypothetical protein
LSGRFSPIDPTASSPGRFSFLRKKKAVHTPVPSSTIELPSEQTMYPKRQQSKDFEFDMENEVEHERDRQSKLPPGGENIWA